MEKQMKDQYLTHNHPSDSSFSQDDYRTAAGMDLKEIRACGKSQTYSLSRPDGGWPDWETIIKPAFEKADKEIMGDIWTKVLNDEISPKVADKVVDHLIWQKISKEYDLDYYRRET